MTTKAARLEHVGEALFQQPAVLAGTLTLWAAVLLLGLKAPDLSAIPQSVQTVCRWTSMLGALSWLAWTVSNGMHLRTAGDWVRYGIGATAFLGRIAFAILLMMNYGHELGDVIPFMERNPGVVYAFAISALLVHALRTGVGGPQPQGVEAVPGTAFAQVGKPEAWVRRPSDLRRTSVHEAGHLLTFALLRELPQGLTVQVFQLLSQKDEYRGKVTLPYEFSDSELEEDLVWQMLLNLAGNEAEMVIYGNRADGAVGDSTRWLRTAVIYLTSGFGEPYYEAPATDAEREHNLLVLNRLKERGRQCVEGFLNENKQLLEELGEAIQTHLFMDLEALKPFLSRTVAVRPVLDLMHARK